MYSRQHQSRTKPENSTSSQVSEVPLTQAPLPLGVFCDCHIGQLPVASCQLLAALMRPWILRAGGLDHIGWIWPGGSKSRTQIHQFRTFLNFCTTSFETTFLCTHWRPRDLETQTSLGWLQPGSYDKQSCRIVMSWRFFMLPKREDEHQNIYWTYCRSWNAFHSHGCPFITGWLINRGCIPNKPTKGEWW